MGSQPDRVQFGTLVGRPSPLVANRTVKPVPYLRADNVQEGDLSTDHDYAEVTGVHKAGRRVTIDVAGGAPQRLAHKRFRVVRVVR